MKIIKENINNYKDPLTTTINTAEADAVRDDKKVQKDTEEILDPMKLKKKKPFTGADKQKGPDQKDLPKNLDKKLTEDIDYDLARPNENKLFYFIKEYGLDEGEVLYDLVRTLSDDALRYYVEYLEDTLDDDLDEDYNDYEVESDEFNDYYCGEDETGDYYCDVDETNDYYTD